MLDDNAYSVSIQKAIEEVTGKPQSVPQLYTGLDRLVKKGALEYRLGSPSHIRGGRAKRLYHLTAEGAAALELADIAERNRAAVFKDVIGASSDPETAKIGFSEGAKSVFDGLSPKLQRGLINELHAFVAHPTRGRPLVRELREYTLISYKN